MSAEERPIPEGIETVEVAGMWHMEILNMADNDIIYAFDVLAYNRDHAILMAGAYMIQLEINILGLVVKKAEKAD